MVNEEKYGSKFSRRLKYLLREKGDTITALAKELELSRQAVSLYVEGKNLPNSEKVCAIADYFDVSADWLLGRTDTRSTDANKQAICDYLNLSETAVDALRPDYDGGKLDGARHFFFDLLLNEPDFAKFIDTAYQYSKFSVSFNSKAADSGIAIYASDGSKGFDMPITVENLSDALNLGLLKKLIPIINSAYENWLTATTAYFSREASDDG